MDLFDDARQVSAAIGAADGLRAEATSALAAAKAGMRKFSEDWYRMHGLTTALREPKVRFVPSGGEPQVRRALEAVVSASAAAAALGPEAAEAFGYDLGAIEAAGEAASDALSSMRGIVVTYAQVAEALDGRFGSRETDRMAARVRSALREADRDAVTSPSFAPSP
jgi:hypothetical protein